jgi:hypothetical protein
MAKQLDLLNHLRIRGDGRENIIWLTFQLLVGQKPFNNINFAEELVLASS